MKIAVSANGTDLDAATSPVFGRCPTYIFVETETGDKDRPLAFEAVENPAMNAAGGAGIQAAQYIVERGAQAVISGNLGPNAFNVLQSAGVSVHLFGGGTVREAVESYKNGQLPAVGGASVRAHAGMGMGRGIGRGRGLGTGRGMGRRAGGAPFQTQPADSPSSREEEIASLKDTADALRGQLAEVTARLERLEKKA